MPSEQLTSSQSGLLSFQPFLFVFSTSCHRSPPFTPDNSNRATNGIPGATPDVSYCTGQRGFFCLVVSFLPLAGSAHLGPVSRREGGQASLNLMAWRLLLTRNSTGEGSALCNSPIAPVLLLPSRKSRHILLEGRGPRTASRPC